MNYIEHSKLFEEWFSAKNAKDQYSTDLQDVKNYLDQLLEKQNKALANTTMAKKKKTRKEQLLLPFLLKRLKKPKQMKLTSTRVITRPYYHDLKQPV